VNGRDLVKDAVAVIKATVNKGMDEHSGIIGRDPYTLSRLQNILWISNGDGCKGNAIEGR